MREFRFFPLSDFRLPGFVPAVTRCLPQWPHAVALTVALNAMIRLGVLPKENLEPLEGRTFLVEVLDAGSCVSFAFRDGAFFPVASGTPDLIFRANLSAFLRLVARRDDPDTLFFNRELFVEGDTELGLVVKNTLDAIEWPKIPEFAAWPIVRCRV